MKDGKVDNFWKITSTYCGGVPTFGNLQNVTVDENKL